MKKNLNIIKLKIFIPFLIIVASASVFITPKALTATNNAKFVSQSVPLTMITGQTQTVSITMKNTGTSSWTKAANYKLGSQNPQDNMIWGLGRVLLNDGEIIAPGQTKTFTFNITAPTQTGIYNFEWRMLKEGVEWFGENSVLIRIEVRAAARTLYPCAITNPNDAANQIQSCLNNAPAESIVEIPAGVYGIKNVLSITKPLVFRTQGKSFDSPSCSLNDATCATLKRTVLLPKEIGGTTPIIKIRSSNVWLDHLIFDGNKAIGCNYGDNSNCENVVVWQGGNPYDPGNDFRFTNNVSKESFGNGSLSLPGGQYPTERSFIYNNLFAFNGNHSNSWSDGLRLGWTKYSAVVANTFLDNTDVELILGNGGYDRVLHNRIVHTLNYAGQSFATIMLNCWWRSDGQCPGDNQAGIEIASNEINCGPKRRCGIGLMIGISPWREIQPHPTPDVSGLANQPILVHDNFIKNSQVGLNIDDAQYLKLYDNQAYGIPLNKNIYCHNSQHPNETPKSKFWTFNYNVSPDSLNINQTGDDIPPSEYKHFSTTGCIADAPDSNNYPTTIFTNDALFVAQGVPTKMIVGQIYHVFITVTNSGAQSWTKAANYKLGSQNPQDNMIWGLGRVLLNDGEIIAPGQTKTFTFNIKAPSTPGVYNFQWRMLKEGVEWFGDYTPNLAITVTQ